MFVWIGSLRRFQEQLDCAYVATWGSMAKSISGSEPLASLNLVGDGDDDDLAVAIESSFGVVFPENEQWSTVGDIHQFLLDVRSPGDQPGRCATAMAFHMLRREIEAPGAKHSPSARLVDVLAGSPKHALKSLSEKTDLVLPNLMLSTWGRVGLGCILAALGSLLAGLGLAATLFAMLAVILLYGDPLRYPVNTLGELADRAAGLNFLKLAEKGADGRGPTIWKALTSVIANDTGNDPGRITKETLLYSR